MLVNSSESDILSLAPDDQLLPLLDVIDIVPRYSGPRHEHSYDEWNTYPLCLKLECQRAVQQRFVRPLLL